MRRAARIAQQYNVFMVKPVISHHREFPPERPVGDDRMTLQVFPEHLFNIRFGIILGKRIHPGVHPGLMAAFHYPGRHALFIAVPVHPPPAVFVPAENKDKTVQGQGGSQPAEAIGTPVQTGAELLGVGATQDGGNAVTGDHQVVLVDVQLRQVGDIGIEFQVYAQFITTVVERVEQLQARHAAEAVPAAGHFCTVYAGLYLVPVGKLLDDTLVTGRIGLHEAAQGFIGKHHAEPPGSATGTALDHGNIVRWISFFHQEGEIQRSRPSAKTDYFQTVHVSHSS